MTEVFFLFLAILAGMTMPVQSGLNAQLQQHWAQNALLAGAVNFAVGTVALIAVLLIMRVPVPALGGKTTPWQWLGGFLGAYFVTVMTFLAPRLGAATLIGFILAGQIGISLVLDHFGLVGYEPKPVNWQRILGALLVGGGVFLIRRF
ncbi:DMT family transporter [Desulfovibrio sp. OttesenSCG-928-O18]|nr:DMT family transporter [Desulfovibrio sp. OttesenSCG-928-O18]